MDSWVFFNWFPSLSLFSAPLYLVTPVASSLSPSQIPSLPARKPPAAALQTQLGPDPGAARPGAALRHGPVPHPHGVSPHSTITLMMTYFNSSMLNWGRPAVQCGNRQPQHKNKWLVKGTTLIILLRWHLSSPELYKPQSQHSALKMFVLVGG